MGVRDSIKNHLLEKNFYLTKITSHFWWYVNSLGKQPLVIYQMGRVGSTTILRSLQSLDLDGSLFHVHVLSHENIKNVEKEYYSENRKILRRSYWPETRHLYMSYFLRKQLDKDLKGKRWKFVTLIRDPIARNISYYFFSIGLNKLDRLLPINFFEQRRSNSVKTRKLAKRFLRRFHENSVEYKIPLTWFDFEFRPVLGIDVFSSEFPKSMGYQIYEGEFADVLLLKLESINETAAEAFAEFLGLQKFSLVTTNTARERQYYSTYKEFLKLADLPLGYIDKIYDSKYVQHFYSIEEINSFREKWHKSSLSVV
jgi:hypothetical protein